MNFYNNLRSFYNVLSDLSVTRPIYILDINLKITFSYLKLKRTEFEDDKLSLKEHLVFKYQYLFNN